MSESQGQNDGDHVSAETHREENMDGQDDTQSDAVAVIENGKLVAPEGVIGEAVISFDIIQVRNRRRVRNKSNFYFGNISGRVSMQETNWWHACLTKQLGNGQTPRTAWLVDARGTGNGLPMAQVRVWIWNLFSAQ